MWRNKFNACIFCAESFVLSVVRWQGELQAATSSQKLTGSSERGVCVLVQVQQGEGTYSVPFRPFVEVEDPFGPKPKFNNVYSIAAMQEYRVSKQGMLGQDANFFS
jgi:hypothetical protein